MNCFLFFKWCQSSKLARECMHNSLTDLNFKFQTKYSNCAEKWPDARLNKRDKQHTHSPSWKVENHYSWWRCPWFDMAPKVVCLWSTWRTAGADSPWCNTAPPPPAGTASIEWWAWTWLWQGLQKWNRKPRFRRRRDWHLTLPANSNRKKCREPPD